MRRASALLPVVLVLISCGDPDLLVPRESTGPSKGVVGRPGEYSPNQIFDPPPEVLEDEAVEREAEEPFDLAELDDPVLIDPPPIELPPGPELRGPPYPLVLVHGFAVSADIGPIEYWWKIPEALRKAGQEVYVMDNDPARPPAERARKLAAFVDEVLGRTGYAKVNLIGHSMGGLDSRYLVSSLGYADRVASVTTVATPHRGSPVADAVLGLLPGIAERTVDALGNVLYGILGNDRQQVMATTEVLSTPGAAAFNAANPDDPRVAYFSVVARTSGDPLFRFKGLDYCDAAMFPTFVFMRLLGQHNDGMVPVESQAWGEVVEQMQADHLNEVGQLLGIIGNATNPWRLFVRHAQRQRG